MQSSRVRLLSLFLLFSFIATSCAETTPPSKPIDARVLIISVDGLRPDVLLRSEAPNIRGLMDRGSFTMYAQTTDVAITLPSHTSMLTGAKPQRHGIHWNSTPKDNQPHHPAVPTLLELATRTGYTTALAAGKAKFFALARKGTVTWSYVPKKSVSGDVVADKAVAMIQEHRPQVLFVHLPDVDSVGHHIGWGTPEQIAAVERIDQAVGRILNALKSAALLDRTTIILSADHGGSGRSHGPNDPRSRYIPWIIAGPNIRQKDDLTHDRSLTVHTEDTFATACQVLGMPIPRKSDGRAVTQVFEKTE